MTNVPFIIGLDISSTNIGFVFYHGVVVDHAEWTLSGDIAERCKLAYNRFYTTLERYPEVDCLAIEAPVLKFAGCIPQIRVSGVILMLAAQRDIPYIEISPSAAKMALSGKGNASKGQMQEAAKQHGITGEHAADALGVAISASRQIEVVA